MALVCGIESAAVVAEEGAAPAPDPEIVVAALPDKEESEENKQAAEDLEDGEIEDDDGEEEEAAPTSVAPAETAAKPEVAKIPPSSTPIGVVDKEKEKANNAEKERSRHERERRSRHEEKKKHMTEAEKSILHLRKRERLQREKWEKFRKEQQLLESPVVDDFAINIEKAIASVLKKDSKHSGEDDSVIKEEDNSKRSRKRQKRDRERAIRHMNKMRKLDSPKSSDLDESEFLNVRGGSPRSDDKKRTPSPRSPDDSYDSGDYSSDADRPAIKDEQSRPIRNKREFNKKNKQQRNRERKRKKSRERERRAEQQLKDAQDVCVFFLQGKCQKNDCPYSHEAVPPMKLELCKFYLMECCAKGDKCSYMHSEFPCKFYHTGLQCLQGDNCKFAHGKPLSDGLKQILFKHIETAPREILGGFPRMSREEALNMINTTQQSLQQKYGTTITSDNNTIIKNDNIGIPPELQQQEERKERPPRSRPSRWQDPDPLPPVANHNPPHIIKPFITNFVQDQDMRFTSNGDVDMRTLPTVLNQPAPTMINEELQQQNQNATNFTQDIDIRNPNMLQFDSNSSGNRDVDIRQHPNRVILPTGDVDIRQIPPVFEPPPGIEDDTNIPATLPKMQRDLFLRIQSQQKTMLPEQQQQQDNGFQVDDNINWYSDDDDDDENRLTIKVDNDDEITNKNNNKSEDDNSKAAIMSPPQINKPLELGDLSKIDISAEVTKLLTSITQTASSSPKEPPSVKAPSLLRDPRQMAQPRDNQQESGSSKISIYEQGSIGSSDTNKTSTNATDDIVIDDIRGRPDVDLRNLQLPFKGMMNYTPAKEIDASVNSHPPMVWKVEIVDIPRPDYTGLKLSVQDAEKTGDPRLRKIFRLSCDEKDSPASPKSSPRATTTRIDPRLKKSEEQQPKPGEAGTMLNYAQQLSILQSSAFFQSLTSNQKVLLTQELATRNDQNNTHDPILNSLLTNLNLIPQNNLTNPNMNAALSILSNVNKLNPALLNANPMVLNQINPMNQMVQPGLLGAAPGIPNIPNIPDFAMNFDPRNGAGILGNGPPAPFGNFQNHGGGDNFNNQGGGNDYYQHQDNNSFSGGGHGRDNRERNFNNRDRRRGRNNFNNYRNNRNFKNRNNNRSNRSHSPP